MKVLFCCATRFAPVRGGFEIQIEQTRQGLLQLEVDVDYLRWFDPKQKGDSIYFLGRPTPHFLQSAHETGWQGGGAAVRPSNHLLIHATAMVRRTWQFAPATSAPAAPDYIENSTGCRGPICAAQNPARSHIADSISLDQCARPGAEHPAFQYGRPHLGDGQGIERKGLCGGLSRLRGKRSVRPESGFRGRQDSFFVFVAGTGGNVQKGLDLLIEAFAKLPHLHLYIYCRVEEEVRRAYRKDLALRNIHYVYPYAARPHRPAMRRLLRRINFTITAPMDIGPGTAFLASLGLGLVPVGYVDIEANETNSVLSESYSIEALIDCAERASQKSAAWCRQASQETLDRFRRLHDPPAFGANFKAYLDRLGL